MMSQTGPLLNKDEIMTDDSSQMTAILSNYYQSFFRKPKNPKDTILGEKVKHTIENIEVSGEQFDEDID